MKIKLKKKSAQGTGKKLVLKKKVTKSAEIERRKGEDESSFPSSVNKEYIDGLKLKREVKEALNIMKESWFKDVETEMLKRVDDTIDELKSKGLLSTRSEYVEWRLSDIVKKGVKQIGAEGWRFAFLYENSKGITTYTFWRTLSPNKEKSTKKKLLIKKR